MKLLKHIQLKYRNNKCALTKRHKFYNLKLTYEYINIKKWLNIDN